MKRSVTLLALVLLVSGTRAATWSVPTDQPTIQAAIDLAGEGDTVLVEPGLFMERLLVENKNLQLLGSGYETTFLSGAGMVGDTLSILTLRGTDTTMVVRGFTFEDNGSDSLEYSSGGAVCIDYSDFGSACTIEENRFRRNFAYLGGAISTLTFDTPGPRIRNNRFEENTALVRGGAVALDWSCEIVISGNEFVDNVVLGSTGYVGLGGAIGRYGFDCDSGYVTNNVFFRNRSGYGAAIGANGGAFVVEGNTFVLNEGTYVNTFPAAINLIYSDATADIRNNVFALTLDGWAVGVSNGASATFDCNVFWLNEDGEFRDGPVGPGNLIADPRLCDPFAGNLYVAPDSPCLPVNNAGCGLIGALGQGCGTALGVPDDEGVLTARLLALRLPQGGILFRWTGEPPSRDGWQLQVHDVLGRLVHSAVLRTAEYRWRPDEAALASGVYFARLLEVPAVAPVGFVLVR